MVSVKLFGVTRDIVGLPILEIPTNIENVGQLKQFMMTTYPRIRELNTLMVAVNSEYAKDEQVINPPDEIALIPPVSGG